ncbi:MAG TPA: NADH:ubiquinone oxidoreductase [Mucilaginibacter sp.]|jgi:Ni,Fe-hydrogenase III small subunit/NAD-dependent dihydropyrimidine dehydrogenase PreA subunit|nr:NADH:ubiquinone oxidoreductase [Mucilaginibacter sp.]
MLDNLKILFHQGKQYIPDVTAIKVPGIFRGRPVISSEKVNETELMELCPTNAISINPVCIDLGKCTFCGECAFAFPNKIKFTTDYKIAANDPQKLIIREGQDEIIELSPELIREEIYECFSGSLKLRQVSAGGDNSCELELNACGNVNFDMGRFGIEFVASPRHADGIVITGPITENMAGPLQICYDAIPEPKIIILAGTDAISGGIFDGSKALNRSFLTKYKIDLYVPGNPLHPLTFINGVLDLIKKRK